MSISQVYFFLNENSRLLFMLEEGSETVHYLGFLDTATKITWPCSHLKKEHGLTEQIILFDLCGLVLFFIVSGDDL